MADPRYNSIHNWLDSRFSQVDIGDGTNQFSVSSTGTLSLSGSATGWDDLRFPFTATKLGALDKPDFDATNVGLLFPVNDATEIIYIIAQMPHEYKEGSRIYPHLHWQQMNGNNVVWKAAYKWFNKGGLVPADFTIISGDSSDNLFTYVSGNLHQTTLMPTGGVDGTEKNISSMLLFKVYRDDLVDGGAGSSDALAFEFDIHYEIDSHGSETRSTK
jgi:hypothetical protein